MAEYDPLIAAGRERLRQWRLEEALAAFDAALRLLPDAAVAHYLRGETLFLQRRLDEALDAHAAASRHGVGREGVLGEAMSGMVPGDFAWMGHMLRGDFESAWRLADADRERRRRARIDTAAWPRHLRPVWDGSSLDRRRVLVRCYHGLGDTLHFIRYLRLLAGRARSVTVEAQPELLDLLTGMPGIARLFPLHPARDRAAAEFGCEIEIDVTELPYAFRATLEAIPAALPLHLDPARLEAARRRVAAVPARRKIGLVWAAGAWKPERSITVERLAPLGAVPGTGLVVLQRGPEHARWRRGRYGPRFSADLGSDDIADAAATIAGLDLVVTVDTMVAHLAGTLGVPVSLMLHFAADWRWLLGRDDSPWYPSMRLFRQPAAGDWDSVVAQIAAALAGADSEAATPPLLVAAAGPAAGVAAPLRR